MNVALEGNHICHAVKMVLHISGTAVYLSSFSQSTGKTLGIPSQKDCLSGKVDHPAVLISFKN